MVWLTVLWFLCSVYRLLGVVGCVEWCYIRSYFYLWQFCRLLLFQSVLGFLTDLSGQVARLVTLSTEVCTSLLVQSAHKLNLPSEYRIKAIDSLLKISCRLQKKH